MSHQPVTRRSSRFSASSCPVDTGWDFFGNLQKLMRNLQSEEVRILGYTFTSCRNQARKASVASMEESQSSTSKAAIDTAVCS